MKFIGFSSAILVAFAMTLQSSHAGVVLYNTFCEDVTQRGITEEICASMEATTPSPAIVDGETVYIGDYSVKYYYEQEYDFLTFNVEYSDAEDSLCAAYINDVECDSCRKRESPATGETTIRVDCRNVPDGRRSRRFQSIELGTMFFPLDLYTLNIDPIETPEVLDSGNV